MSRRGPRRFVSLACGLLLAAGAVPTGSLTAAAAAAPAGCQNPSSYTTEAGSFDRTHHPLVLVHGWQGSSNSMWPVEQGLQKLVPDTFDVRYFDYREAADQWAAKPAIAACLADYVDEVSANNRRDGGDGKVYLVGHSTGGLAIRFATDPASVPKPIPAAGIGGVVTFDTPHQGSPFGNTLLATIAQFGQGAFKGSWPDKDSDAAKCLARHDDQHTLPAGCATPPYFPNGTRVTQIAATNTVRRTLFGITLYDLALNSDGVVTVDSSHGYLNSGPTGTDSPRGAISLPDVGCVTTSDQTIKLLKTAVTSRNLASGIIKAELQALGQLWNDSAALDQIISGDVGPQLAVMLATALFVYPCGHKAMLSHPDALRAAADALLKDIADNRTTTEEAPVGGDRLSFAGEWDAKFSHLSIDPAGTGTLTMNVPCCTSGAFPIRYETTSDSVTVIVTGPPTIQGDFNGVLPDSTNITFRWAEGFEGQILTGRYPDGTTDAFLCGPDLTDDRCYP